MSNEPLSNDPSMDYANATPVSEGHMAKAIGTAIFWASLVSAGFCVFFLGRTPDGEGWNLLFVSIYLASGLNGAFFGYLLSKVGSVLKHLEALQPKA